MSYTQVFAHITDQELQLSNLPLLASGGENVVKITCAFCPLWDGYGKLAVFYRKGGPVFHIPVVDNEAVVPHEVTSDAGTVFFGILGTKENLRTTEVVRLNFEQGAISPATAEPEDPTPDIYQQLIAVYGLTEARLNEMMALHSGEGLLSYDFSDGVVEGSIVSNGSAAAICFNLIGEDAQLEPGARYYFELPEEFLPLYNAELSVASGNTLYSNITVNLPSKDEQLSASIRCVTENISGAKRAYLVVDYQSDSVDPINLSGYHGYGTFALAQLRYDEVTDIRVGSDGVRYPTAGAAVRSQSLGKGIRYYASLSDAIGDVNAGSADNAQQDTSAAVAQVFTGEDGRTKVVLLSDTSASAAIDIGTDLDLILNGKVLTLADPTAVFTFAQGTSCTIDGTVPGSKIFFNSIASSSNYNAITVNGSTLTVLGGEYELSCNISGQPSLFKATPTCETFTLDSCAMTVANSSAASAGTKCIQSQVAKLGTIRNCQITVTHSNTKGQAIAYLGSGAAVFDNCTVTCAGYTAVGLDDYGSATLKDTTVSVVGQKASYGARNYGNTMTIESSKIVADAPGDDADEESSLGILNSAGTCIIKASEVFGTLAGVQNHGMLYVEGGTYTGYSHGGFYFSHGASGLAYVVDATIRCANYEGVFADVFAGDTVVPLGGFYIGGGTAARNSNMAVYLDGCTIGEPGYRAFVLRNSNGETNNTVNISNSTVVDGAQSARIDSGTGHLVNLGIGADIATENADQTVKTGLLYRRKHPDAECTGKDYAALVSFMNAQTSE